MMARRRDVIFGGERRGRTNAAKLAVKSRHLIVCGGEVTEREYFEYVAGRLRANIELQLAPRGYAPRQLVEEAIRLNEKAQSLARKHGDPDDTFDHVWIITDVDDFPTEIHEARDLAKSHHVNLIETNPCFELWLLWHIQDHGKPMSQQEIQAAASKAKLVSGKHINSAVLTGRLEAASKRANRQDKHWEDSETFSPHNNPSSAMPLVLRTMIDAAQRSSVNFTHNL